MFNMEKFAGLLSRKRREKGLTQEQLSDLVGVTHQAVSKWERGEAMPEISKIGDIAKAIDTPADELINSLYEVEPISQTSSVGPENINSADEAYFALADKTRVGDIYALAPKMSKETLQIAIDTLVAAKGAGAATMLFRFADREYLSNLGATLFANGDTRLAEYVDESVIQGAVVDLISKAEITPHDPEKREYFTKVGQLLAYCHESEFINDAFDRMIASFGNWDIWRGFIGRFPSEVVVHQGIKIATRLGPNCFHWWWDVIGRRNIAKIFIGYIENYDKNNYRAWQDISGIYGNADGSIMEKYIKERLSDEETDPKIFKPLLKHLGAELKSLLQAKGVSEEQPQNNGNFNSRNSGSPYIETNHIRDTVTARIAEEIYDVDIEELPAFLQRLKNVGVNIGDTGDAGTIKNWMAELDDRLDDIEDMFDEMNARLDGLNALIAELSENVEKLINN